MWWVVLFVVFRTASGAAWILTLFISFGCPSWQFSTQECRLFLFIYMILVFLRKYESIPGSVLWSVKPCASVGHTHRWTAEQNCSFFPFDVQGDNKFPLSYLLLSFLDSISYIFFLPRKKKLQLFSQSLCCSAEPSSWFWKRVAILCKIKMLLPSLL